jgi:tRNA nucleotidyltransferase (CCA-adding enzyme)
VGIEPPSSTASPVELRRLASRVGRSRLASLYRLWIARVRADRKASVDRASEVASAWRSLRRELRSEPPLSEEELALDGRDLIAMGLKPGPRFGEILAHLLDRVLEDPSLNSPDTLRRQVEAFLEGDEGEGAPSPPDSHE